MKKILRRFRTLLVAILPAPSHLPLPLLSPPLIHREIHFSPFPLPIYNSVNKAFPHSKPFFSLHSSFPSQYALVLFAERFTPHSPVVTHADELIVAFLLIPISSERYGMASIPAGTN